MTLYAIALFLHITGALGLFAGFALEWTALSGLRRATTAEQAREWASIFRLVRGIGPVSVGLLLVFGIYLTVASGGPTPWIGLGFLSLVAIMALGAVSGVRFGRAAASTVVGSGPLSVHARATLRRPLFVWSLRLRVALALAVVFLMTVKPETPAALAIVGGALVLAALATATTSRAQPMGVAATPRG